MNQAILQYFDRAAWALHNTTNSSLDLHAKSYLTAAALHACQSLKEALDQAAAESPDDAALIAGLGQLPHVELIDNVRNMDLHGWPLPVCDPKVRSVMMVSKPGQPIEVSSSQGVAVAMTMKGLAPRVQRSPKDLKHGKVAIGGSTVSMGCDHGTLVVHDFSTDKAYPLLEVLRAFLERCRALIKSRLSPPGEAPDGELPQAH